MNRRHDVQGLLLGRAEALNHATTSAPVTDHSIVIEEGADGSLPRALDLARAQSVLAIRRTPATLPGVSVGRSAPLWRSPLVLLLIASAVACRLALAVGSPTPFGYVFDFYHEPIVLYHESGVLPDTHDCWQCYHPPLFTVAGERIYAAGLALSGGNQEWGIRSLALFSTLTSGLFLVSCWLLVGLYIRKESHLRVLFGVALTAPCLLISSFAAESDLLCSTLILIALVGYLKYRHGERPVVWLGLAGVASGLAASTKYSGLIIILVVLLLLGVDLIRTRRKTILTHGLLYLSLCAALGAWHYVDNVREHDRLLVGNWAWRHMATEKPKRYYFDHYEFTTFRFGELVELMSPDSPPRELSSFPAYNQSVFTSLYGQLWTDISIFSNPTRHGLDQGLYPAKRIPVPLIVTLLVLGLVPVMLAAVGLITAPARSAEFLPLGVLLVATFAVYVRWVLGFNEWMLKTKYLLALLPAGLVLMSYGLDACGRVNPSLERGAIGALWLLVLAALLYGFCFAVL